MAGIFNLELGVELIPLIEKSPEIIIFYLGEKKLAKMTCSHNFLVRPCNY